MKSIRKCIAVASAVAIAVTGVNQTVINGRYKVMAGEKPFEAVLLDDKDKEETYHKAVVNIFDYNTPNIGEGYNYGFKANYGGQYPYYLSNCGVNRDIREKFTGNAKDKSMDDQLFLFGGERHKYKNQAEYNEWTGEKGGVYQGLVKNQLTSDGSLEFSDGINCIDLFPNSSQEYKNVKSYYNSEFLFQKRDGYYVFDSDEDKICSSASGSALQLKFDFDKKGPIFSTKTGTFGKNYGFFPLNSNDDGVENYTEKRHHMFGMELTIDFNVNESRTVDGNDMEFTFSGDDDVWVFVDDRLVLDLGGIHNKATGSINFRTGDIKYGSDSYPIKNYVNTAKDVTSGAAVSGPAISKKGSSNQGSSLEKALGKKLTKGKHTLKLFYLERGESDSNCMIRFNLGVEESVMPSPTAPIKTSEPTSTPELATSTPEAATSKPTGTPTVPTSTPMAGGGINIPPIIPIPIIPGIPVNPTETPRATATPIVTSIPNQTIMPETTNPVQNTELPETTANPVPTEVVITEEPVPQATIVPTETPWVSEQTMAPNVPKPTDSLQSTEIPVVVTEEPIPGGDIVTPTNTPEIVTTVAPTVVPTVTPTKEPTETSSDLDPDSDTMQIPDTTEEPAGPVKYDSDDDLDDETDDSKDDDTSDKKEKDKATIVLDDSTPGSLPKTGGIADLMENGKAVSCTVIVFLLGSAVIFSVGKLRSKKVKR